MIEAVETPSTFRTLHFHQVFDSEFLDADGRASFFVDFSTYRSGAPKKFGQDVNVGASMFPTIFAEGANGGAVPFMFYARGVAVQARRLVQDDPWNEVDHDALVVPVFSGAEQGSLGVRTGIRNVAPWRFKILPGESFRFDVRIPDAAGVFVRLTLHGDAVVEGRGS